MSNEGYNHIKDLGFTDLGEFFDRGEEPVFVDYVPKISIPNSLGNYYEWKEEMARKRKPPRKIMPG